MRKIFYLWLLIPFLVGLFNLIFFSIAVQKANLVLPLFGLLAAFINGSFFFFTFKKESRLAYFFQGTAFFIQVLILIFLILA